MKKENLPIFGIFPVDMDTPCFFLLSRQGKTLPTWIKLWIINKRGIATTVEGSNREKGGRKDLEFV